MAIRQLIFDLDDTLYPGNNGLWEAIGQRIICFMTERIGLDPAQVEALRGQYFHDYGTTLRGLMRHYPGVDADDYLAYVHDLDLTRYIAPDPALDSMLATLPCPKAIFTNSDTGHTSRVLGMLGIARHFSAIIDIRAMEFENKPLPRAYEILLQRVAAPAASCVLIEDSVRNLRPAQALGMTTVLVGDGPSLDPAVDFQVATILETGDVIKRLIAEE
nr:pyrimidine 5'-nucleotidase [Chloroflexota bacterium]